MGKERHEKLDLSLTQRLGKVGISSNNIQLDDPETKVGIRENLSKSI